MSNKLQDNRARHAAKTRKARGGAPTRDALTTSAERVASRTDEWKRSPAGRRAARFAPYERGGAL